MNSGPYGSLIDSLAMSPFITASDLKFVDFVDQEFG